jgi:hypothetical protein
MARAAVCFASESTGTLSVSLAKRLGRCLFRLRSDWDAVCFATDWIAMVSEPLFKPHTALPASVASATVKPS